MTKQQPKPREFEHLAFVEESAREARNVLRQLKEGRESCIFYGLEVSGVLEKNIDRFENYLQYLKNKIKILSN